MDTGMNVAVSSQLALERRLNTIADNVANANTTGFRATQIRFDEALDTSAASATSFVSRGQSFSDARNAALEQTGGNLDFAVRGEGWFAIRTPAGTAVTRDGRFQMTPEGLLVNVEGHSALDAGGGEIRVDPAGGPVTSDPAGRLRQNGATVGQLGLFAYEPGANPTRVGSSAILTGAAPDPLVDTRGSGIVQGALERSNVDPVREMTRLISVHRAFDNVAALLRDTEGATETMIRTLGGTR